MFRDVHVRLMVGLCSFIFGMIVLVFTRNFSSPIVA
jgi:hypothetical protein